VKYPPASLRQCSRYHARRYLARINQVERWFGYLTDQKLRRGVYKSVQALEADIQQWNENLRPLRLD
jgi:hypothetical protein